MRISTDFLAAVRDDTIWGRAKDLLAPLGGATLETVKVLATDLVKQTLGIDGG